MKLRKLSVAEEELMNIAWKLGRPFSSADIGRVAKDCTWNTNYLHKMLTSLEKKNIIEMCGAVKEGPRFVRQFKALITKEEYIAEMLDEQGVTAKSLKKVAMALVKKQKAKTKEDEEATQKLIEELEEMVRQFEEKQKEK